MTFTEDTLTSIIRRHYPNLANDPCFTPIRTGKFNTSYWVDAGDERLVLRIAPPEDSTFVFYERGMMRQEPELHALVRAKTGLPVAEVLAFDDSHDLIDRDYLLLERLPGRPLTEAHYVDYSYVLYQMGRYLAELHQLKRGQYGYLGAHHPMEPQSSWPEAFRVMWNKLIDDIAAIGYYDESESGFLRSLLDRRMEIFDRPVVSSLLHMDIWHQNILVDQQGKVTGIVDWDRALWGDPEIEFAVLDYCGVSNPPFWDGYGKARDESAEANLRSAFYLLYEIQKYIVIRHGRNHAPHRARGYQAQVLEIAQRIAKA